jgi:zinc protease
VVFNLGDDYYKTYDAKVRKLTKEELQQVGKTVIKPELLTWVVVGDKSKILNSVKELGYEVIEVDADGNVLK